MEGYTGYGVPVRVMIYREAMREYVVSEEWGGSVEYATLVESWGEAKAIARMLALVFVHNEVGMSIDEMLTFTKIVSSDDGKEGK